MSRNANRPDEALDQASTPHAPLPVPQWVDTHAHLDDPRLSGDLSGVLGRARAAGVAQIVAISTTAVDSERTVALAAAHRGLFAAVGIHPNDAAEARSGDWDRILALTDRPGVVALGETGLDRHWNRTPFTLQQHFFELHIALAHQRGLPLVIHSRDCQRDIIAQLARFGRPIAGVQHAFTGTWDEAQALLDLGLYLSFAGQITFANKAIEPLRQVAARVPLDRLLVETDSPYLSPHPYRGRPNEPARVAVTAARLAALRGLAPAQLAQGTTANARRLFRLPDDRTIARD